MPAITGFTTGEILTAANVNQYLLFGNENRIINGDFSVNQRVFSSSTTNGTYGFDRWLQVNGGGTVTYSAQTFTVGNPITGQEPRNFARMVTSGQSAAGDLAILCQKIESVRTLAGQTATISFWARASSGTPKVAVELFQQFGTGGSPSGSVGNYAGQVTLSTSWARYQVSVTVASISGKTIGTNNNDALELNLWTSAGSTYNSRTGSLGIQNNTIEFWGVKVESGAVATPFVPRPQGIELALCQRFYQKTYLIGTAPGASITNAIGSVGLTASDYQTSIYSMTTYTFPLTMRAAPTLAYFDLAGNASRTSSINTGSLAVSHNQNPTLFQYIADSQVVFFGANGAQFAAFLAFTLSAEL